MHKGCLFKNIYSKVSALLKARIESDLKLGHGLENGVNLGPLTTPRSVIKATSHIVDAVARGASVETGFADTTKPASEQPGLAGKEDGYFFLPP